MRRNIAIALTILFAGIAFLMGEGGEFLIEFLPVSLALLGCLSVAAAAPGSWVKRAGIWAGSFAIITAAYFAGAYSFNHAFIECVRKGESVRVQLEAYHAANKQYPESLKQLKSPLPGRRITRPTIIDYKKTTDGYDLTFKDWLTEFKANQSQPFTEHQ